MWKSRVYRWLGSAFLVTALSSVGLGSANEVVTVHPLVSPAPVASLTGNLVASDSKLYLSWLESRGDGHAFRFAAWDGETFSEPMTIRISDAFFANWADFGSLLPLENGQLAAQWLEKAADGTYQYDIWMSLSDDQGKTWSQPERPHRDGTLSEHGFVSLTRHGATGLAGVWLDGRKFQKGASNNEMSLMFTTLEDGVFKEEQLLDGRVCECCQTTMARTESGLVVAYRDRSPDEIRDISVVRYVENAWTDPVTLHADGWQIPGCPVNGPQVATKGDQVAIAWFTGAGGERRVQAKFSQDGGASFEEVMRVDDGQPIGRVDIEMVGSEAIVTWLERTEAGEGIVQFRRLSPSTGPGPSQTIAQTGGGRASGFPRMAVFGDEIFVTWTEAYTRNGDSQVQIARISSE